LKLGMTKLALDNAVAGEGEEGEESAPEKAMKSSLMSMLRKKFDNEEDEEVADEKVQNGDTIGSATIPVVDAEMTSVEPTDVGTGSLA
jgi:hypothetical protein